MSLASCNGEDIGPTAVPCDEPTLSAPLRVRNFALTILATLALVVLLRYAQELFVPLVLSMLIAFALNPFVSLLDVRSVFNPNGAAVRS